MYVEERGVCMLRSRVCVYVEEQGVCVCVEEQGVCVCCQG